ncbi:MAG TPA: TetR/AcrR family transcriptional regulator [Mycobacteriales bacterium]|nr:TetR/AcrR family transcriptional regulator [Mycobacteriales bacterium]
MSASDAPVREPGTRARSGNAMARTRAALLEATGECLARYGVRKTTMVDVAAHSRVAKATLYNHFRTKDDLLAAYVEDRVDALTRAAVAAASASGLPAGLAAVASALREDPALRRAAREEPATLAPLSVPSQCRAWTSARTGAADLLTAARVPGGAAEVALLLRWAASQLLWPVGPDDASAQALVAQLSAVPAVAEPDVQQPAAAPVPALGWPGDRMPRIANKET